MNKIFQFIWILSLIIPFLLLDWRWAFIALLINFIGILPLGILIISVLKPIFGAGHWLLSFFDGIGEAFFYVLLSNLINAPDKFLLTLILVYFVNQFGRIFRVGFQSDEAVTLLGFITFLGINYFL